MRPDLEVREVHFTEYEQRTLGVTSPVAFDQLSDEEMARISDMAQKNAAFCCLDYDYMMTTHKVQQSNDVQASREQLKKADDIVKGLKELRTVLNLASAM